MNSYESRRRKLIIFGIIGLFLIIGVTVVIILTIQENNRTKPNTVFFSNLDSCSKNMQPVIQDSMRTVMYDIIVAANNYNKKESLPNYSAEIREGSCNETEEEVSEAGGVTTLKITSAILDIEAAQQSWRVEYNWLPGGTEIKVDLGTIIVPSCLDKEDLIYNDFNCEKVLSLQQYGTDKVDPILEYMPYSGRGFSLAYNPDTKAVTAEIEVRESQKDNKILINNLKKQIVYWFSSRDLNIKNYSVTYTTKVITSSPSFL